MSDRKRPRLGACQMCGRKRELIQHGKCHECRTQMQFARYAHKGKLDKFRSQGSGRT